MPVSGCNFQFMLYRLSQLILHSFEGKVIRMGLCVSGWMNRKKFYEIFYDNSFVFGSNGFRPKICRPVIDFYFSKAAYELLYNDKIFKAVSFSSNVFNLVFRIFFRSLFCSAICFLPHKFCEAPLRLCVKYVCKSKRSVILRIYFC